ncbi:MobP2 family relaxase [Bacillus cereus]|uniref:MobP2 family relaxase n=1 Tax=Bacillus cereus TaxID=1396 RepID=UPI000B4A7477|nr:MobP2 family relaxase [Bacillus cereus]
MNTPGVVIKSQFVYSKNDFSTNQDKEFGDYIDYIGRKDAVEKEKNEFSSYQDYMGNEEKTSSLFTKEEDVVSLDGKNRLKEAFKKAQKNKSVLWQDVISFDNKWLEKHGIYNSESKMIDEEKLKDVTRKAMDVMMTKERLRDTAIWSAAIHYNTDNIHVHVAMVEPVPSAGRIISKGRFKGMHRGKRKQKSIDAMKSKVVNSIMDRSEEYKKINNLIRNNIVKSKKDVHLSEKRKMKKLFDEIMKELPEDKKQWQYNYTSISHVRDKIDQLSGMYIEKYHKKEFEELKEKLEEEMKIMKEAYGGSEEDKQHYNQFGDTKINDLYTRLGNAVFKEMKQVAKEQQQAKFQKRKNIFSRGKRIRSGFKQRTNIMRSLKNMNYHMNNEYEKWKNQRKYEQLQEQMKNEYER